MVMRQIIKLIFVLSLVIMTSCSTQQRVVYRNCDCNTTTFGFGFIETAIVIPPHSDLDGIIIRIGG